MIGMFRRVRLHALTQAPGAFVFINPVLEYRNGIECRVNGAQGADVLAERAVDEDGREKRDCQ